MNKKRFGLSLVASSLMALAVVVGCTVEDGNGDDGDGSCTSGRTATCTCSNGDHGTQICNSSGTGYGLCDCTGGGEAGAPSGSGGTNGEAGGTSTSYAGETNSYGGEGTTANAGAGGEGVSPAEGGAGGAEASAGAGGQGAGGAPGLCDQPEDPCQECYMGQCCVELGNCLADETCAIEFINVRGCTDDAVAVDDLASPADVDACMEAEAGSGNWRQGVTPELEALVDCMGGEQGWENAGSWDAQTSCRNGCFVAQ